MDAARGGFAVELAIIGGRFDFEPWIVVLDNATWTVVGHAIPIGAARSIRIDRLTEPVRVLHQHRRVPRPTIDAALLASVVDEGRAEPIEATVHVDELAAARAGLWTGVREQRGPDLFGNIELAVDVRDRERFRSWVLGLGARAEVVAPAELRADIATWLQAIVETPPSGKAPPPRPATPARRPGPEPVEVRLRRLVAIVPWLYRQGSAKVVDIAARVGVSPEQVVKDLTTASMCGVPPYTSDALYGFWVDPEEGEVNVVEPTLLTRNVRLTARHAVAVGVALSALEALPGGRTDVIARLREKLEAATGELPMTMSVDEPPFLAELRTAVERNESVRVEYIDLDDEFTTRDVDPHKVFVDRGTSYVIADDHLRGDVRVFRVDRMLSVAGLGTHFEPRSVEVPAGKVWTWTTPAEDVVVRLPPGSKWILDRYAAASHLVDPDGWVTAWLSVVNERWLAVLLMRSGPGAEVLDHDRYTGLAARRASEILLRYR